MVSVIAGIHCHMIMHAFLELFIKWAYMIVLAIVLAGNISLHDCTIVNKPS